MLTGWLCKHDGSDFTGPQVQAMIHDFQRVLHGFTISGDLDNWKFNSEKISYTGDKEQHTSDHGGGEEVQVTYEIDLDDYDFEAS